MRQPIRIALLGADGRMGLSLVSAIAAEPMAVLCAGVGGKDSPHLGRSLYQMAGVETGTQRDDVRLSADLRAALNVCDVLIDFSVPEAAIDAALMMHDVACGAMVSGTTGFSGAERAAFDAAAQAVCVVRSGNFSLGVNMLTALVEQAAARLGEDWDIEITDIHHRHKVDAPSGTALMLGEAAAAGRRTALSRVQVLTHKGARAPGQIGFSASRLGGVIGEHSVMFGSESEVLTLSHSALDRQVFAKGALRAALWAAGRAPGHYDMKDVLGL